MKVMNVLSAAACAALIAVSSAGTAMAAETVTGGAWKTSWSYVMPDGSRAKNVWVQTPDGKWYHMDQDGIMQTGWFYDQNGKWYYLKQDGSMATGWVLIGQRYYYLNPSGDMVANGKTPDGYTVNADGAWCNPDGSAIVVNNSNSGTATTRSSGSSSGGGGSSSSSSNNGSNSTDKTDPEQPNKPEQPDKPENPEQPDKPDQPENPTVLHGSAAVGYGYYAKVAVTVNDDGTILSVEDDGTVPKEDGLSPAFWNKALQFFDTVVGKNRSDLKAMKTTPGGSKEEKADAVSGATYSSNAIRLAVLDALGESEDSDDFVINDENVLTEYTGDSELVVIPDGIQAIDEYSFSGKENVKKVVIPASVTYINSSAFENCSSLNDFEVAEDNEEYYTEDGVIYDKKADSQLVLFPCGRDGAYSVPDTVKTIGDGAFYTSRLESLKIPASVETIGSGIVDYCSFLTTITVSEDNAIYSSSDGIVYDKSQTRLVIVPPGISGEHTIPNTVTELGDFAFYSCYKLTKINLPGKLKTLPKGVFAGCSGLKTIQLPVGLETIEDRAFIGCTSLESIKIPEGLTNFGSYVFTQCTSLQSIKVDELNFEFNSKNGVLFNAYGDTLYAYPTGKSGDYVIPSGTVTIKQGAFFSAMDLGTVTVPDSVTDIEPIAFVMPGNDMRPANFKLKGSAGSAAAEHATIYGIEFETVGDSQQPVIPEKGLTEKIDGVSYRTYDGKTARVVSVDDDVKEIIIPDNVTIQGMVVAVNQINVYAFLGSAVETIVVGDNVEKIMDMAFMECSKLRSVTLGAKVSKCDYSVFNACYALEEISVSSENATFFDNDGVLYEDIDEENRTLVHYPSARADEEYEILNGTTSVADSAFEKAKNLKLVTFPEGVHEIGDDAFYGHNAELVIAAPSGSAAASYAKENEITFKSTDEDEKVEDTKDSENDGITSNTEEINKNDSKSEDESNKDGSDKVEDIDKNDSNTSGETPDTGSDEKEDSGNSESDDTDESGKDDSGNTEENDDSDNIGEVDSENTETEENSDEESGDKESADLT